MTNLATKAMACGAKSSAEFYTWRLTFDLIQACIQGAKRQARGGNFGRLLEG